jgi:outer membrane immunogenic protein
MMKLLLLAAVAGGFALPSMVHAQDHAFSGPRLGAEVAYEDFGAGVDGAAVAVVAGWDFDLGGNWVLGAEGRVALVGVGKDETTPTPGGQNQRAEVSIEDNWGLGVRIGHVVGPVLLFAQGGYERLHVDAVRTLGNQVCVPPTGCVISRTDFSFNEDLWSLGAGAEWAITPNLRLKGQYTHAEGDAFNRERLSIGVGWQF